MAELIVRNKELMKVSPSTGERCITVLKSQGFKIVKITGTNASQVTGPPVLTRSEHDRATLSERSFPQTLLDASWRAIQLSAASEQGQFPGRFYTPRPHKDNTMLSNMLELPNYDQLVSWGYLHLSTDPNERLAVLGYWRFLARQAKGFERSVGTPCTDDAMDLAEVSKGNGERPIVRFYGLHCSL